MQLGAVDHGRYFLRWLPLKLVGADNNYVHFLIQSTLAHSLGEIIRTIKSIAARRIFAEHQYVCVGRPRRFEKSMAGNMLNVYYSRRCDSVALSCDLKVASIYSSKEDLDSTMFLNEQYQSCNG